MQTPWIQQKMATDESFRERRMLFFAAAEDMSDSLREAEKQNIESRIGLQKRLQGTADECSERMRDAAYGINISGMGKRLGGKLVNIATLNAHQKLTDLAGRERTMLEKEFQKNIDSVLASNDPDYSRLSYVGAVIAGTEARYGGLWDQSQKLLDSLQKQHITAKMTRHNLEEKLVDVEEFKQFEKDSREIKGLGRKLLRPKAVMTNIYKDIKDGVSDKAEKYLHIAANNDEWGEGRLNTSIKALKEIEDHTAEKVEEIKKKMQPDLDKPKKAIAFIAKKLGRSESIIGQMVDNYVTNSGGDRRAIFDLINSSNLQPSQKEVLVNAVEGFKTAMGHESNEYKAAKSIADHNEAVRAISDIEKDREKVKLFRESILKNNILKGNTLQLFWGEQSNELAGMELPRGMMRITGVNTADDSFECMADDEPVFFNLKTGLIEFQGAYIPMHYLSKNFRVKKTAASDPVVLRSEQPRPSEEYGELRWKDQSAKLIREFGEMDMMEHSSEIKEEVRIFNRSQGVTGDGSNKKISGSIKEVVHDTSQSKSLVFIEFEDGRYYCDVAEREKVDIFNDADGSPWVKPSGVEFSYEENPNESTPREEGTGSAESNPSEEATPDITQELENTATPNQNTSST